MIWALCCNRFFMPPKQEVNGSTTPSSFGFDGRSREETYRWMLDDDLSGRHDMSANAETTKSAAFLMQLSAISSVAVVLICIFRMLQVRHCCN